MSDQDGLSCVSPSGLSQPFSPKDLYEFIELISLTCFSEQRDAFIPCSNSSNWPMKFKFGDMMDRLDLKNL